MMKPLKMKPASTPAALAAVAKALDHIQEAQNQLGLASQQLSQICFGSDLQNKAMLEYDRVHKLWYVVNTARESRGGMHLDKEPAPKTQVTQEGGEQS